MSSTPVEVDSITVELGGNTVLDGISLSVEPAEFVTLLGPSGSGKTTTLNVIAGFVQQRSGHVRFADEVMDSIPVHRRDIGMVFQSYALFPHLSVGKNVAYALRSRRVPRAEREKRTAEVLSLVRLSGLETRSVNSLSGGQQQRVALARALVFQPRVLLLDEPLAALDRQLRDAMQVELKRIQRETQITTISVTHDQVEAMTMSDRIAIMNEGRIEQVGHPEDLYRKPATLFVAGFLGETNLLAVDPAGQVDGFDLRLDIRRGGTAVARPEDVEICPADSGECQCRASVEQVSYQGTRYLVAARLSGDSRVLVSQSAASSEPPPVGGEIGLTVDPRRLHIIDGDPGERHMASEPLSAGKVAR